MKTHEVRFQGRAFATRPNQRVVIVTQRGRTEVRSILGSRDVVVSGTVTIEAPTFGRASVVAEAVRVVETSPSEGPDQELRLEVRGIPVNSTVRFRSVFLVPKDVPVEILDGPEDLLMEGLEAGVVIDDGAGDIHLKDIDGVVRIIDLDGDIIFSRGTATVTIVDRRGDIVLEEITGDIDITDREDDALIQSVTGRLTMGKLGRGVVRINNLDGEFVIREWSNNVTRPIINSIWQKEQSGPESPRPTPTAGRPEAEPSKAEPLEGEGVGSAEKNGESD